MNKWANPTAPLAGMAVVGALAIAALLLARLPVIVQLGISPLVVGILLGIVYANTLAGRIGQAASERLSPGIHFCTRQVLRLGIVLYGLRIAFADLLTIGPRGLLVSLVMVVLTFLVATHVGRRWFGLDRDTAMLMAAGASVCGAAAVLATEPVLRAEPYKSAVAVSMVVVFGTLSMFLYPAMQHLGWLHFSPLDYGIYVGGSVHEVAQVVAAGSAVSPAAAASAIIVKMTRVMLLAPALIMLTIYLGLRAGPSAAPGGGRVPVVIPWFAVWFLVLVLVHPLLGLPPAWVGLLNHLDTFLLTVAMTALGMETIVSRFRHLGLAPLYTGAVTFVWLLAGGYGVNWLIKLFF